MGNTILPFDELMKAVLEQLKSQKYMNSTLTVYRRTYNRIHIFLNHHGTDVYTHELGKAFLADSNISKTTFVAYICAVRRLDDYIDGKPYRCHHGDYDKQIPLAFADTLTGYLQECIDNGNKPATICSKERTCISFLCFVENAGCSDLSQLNTGIVSRALLTYSNKDAYARIRQFLNYLVEKGINECFAVANVNTAGKKHGPHAFRSSLASSMVNDNASYEVVRRILGHSNPDVIKHYAKADIENLRMCSIEPPIPTGIFRDYLSGREVITHG